MNVIIDLPNYWKIVRLGDYCDLQNGVAFKSQDYVEHSNTLVFRMSQIRPGGILDLNHNSKYLPDEFNEIYKKYKLKESDVVIAMTDMAAETKILGVPTFFKTDGRNYLLNQRVGRLFNINKEQINVVYLRYVLTAPIINRYYKSFGKGAVQINLGKDDILNAQIPLPPLSTQQAIVSKIEELFSELDKGIENLKIADAQLKTYRQSVLKWAFEGKLTYDKVNDGELPKGWKWSNLKELKIFSLYGPRFSSKDYTENGIAVLRTTDISERGKVDWINSPKLNLTENEYQKYKIIKNDLLITRTGSIGRLSIFNDDKKAIPGAFLIHYRLIEHLNIWYIFYFLKSQKAQKHFSEHSFGVGRPNLNVPNIELLNIPLAPIEEQLFIVEAIESRLSIADKMEESIKESLLQAEVLRQSILKKAFEGKLI